MITENEILMALEEIERCPHERRHSTLEGLLKKILETARQSKTVCTQFSVCRNSKITDTEGGDING